jgi:hypothetical protein
MKIRFSGRRTLTLTGKLACLGSAVSAANDHPRASNAYKSGPPMAAIAQPDGQKSLHVPGAHCPAPSLLPGATSAPIWARLAQE